MGDCTNTPPPIFSDGGNHRYDGLVEAAIAEDAMTVASLNSMTRSIGSDSTLKADTIPEFEKLRIDYAKLEQELPNIITTHPILHAYLMEQSQDYRYVTLWRRKVSHFFKQSIQICTVYSSIPGRVGPVRKETNTS